MRNQYAEFTCRCSFRLPRFRAKRERLKRCKRLDCLIKATFGRFCCSIASFFCFGTTHFCDACHHKWVDGAFKKAPSLVTPPDQTKAI